MKLRISAMCRVIQRESQGEMDSRAKYLPQIAATCTRVAEMVDHALGDGQVPAGAGRRSFDRGGHACPACRDIFIGEASKLGLIWIDAHADMNTPDSSPSGNVHGMPLACCIGQGPQELTGHFRLLAEGGSGECRAGRDAHRWMMPERDIVQQLRGSCFYHARHRRARDAGGV